MEVSLTWNEHNKFEMVQFRLCAYETKFKFDPLSVRSRNYLHMQSCRAHSDGEWCGWSSNIFSQYSNDSYDFIKIMFGYQKYNKKNY